MDPAHLDELVTLEDSYWWHVAKRELAIKLLQEHCPPPGRLVEGGIGSCRNLLTFRQLGYDVTGFDIMPQSVAHGEKRGLDDLHVHDLTQPWPVEPGSVRAVVLLDVLEHLDDPVATLRHIHEALDPEGALIVTVPAYQWLYSDWDQALGHYRRYTASLLRTHAQEAGLNVRMITHWNAFTLPAAMAVRGLQRVRPAGRRAEFPRVSSLTNRLLLGCAGVERRLMDVTGVPCGLSVVGVLTR
jgi:SAM-dependent methyltransferase